MGAQALCGKYSGPKSYLTLGLIQSRKGGSETPQVLSILSSVLERTIQRNERSMKKSPTGREPITIFHGTRAPSLTIGQYLDRIFKYSACSPSCLVLAYVYLDRFLQKTGLCLTSLNVHRLLITSSMLADKFHEDECYNNAYYAKVGGVSTQEINRLELEFLSSIEFSLHVTVETFNSYCSFLEEEANSKSPIDRPVQLYGPRQGMSSREPYFAPAYGRLRP
ncbi:hypothetical protein NMG60_11032185 [Bertholletia excelsa]